jgi:hypothetical protein
MFEWRVGWAKEIELRREVEERERIRRALAILEGRLKARGL